MQEWGVEEVCAWVLREVEHQGEAIAAVLKSEEITGEVLFSFSSRSEIKADCNLSVGQAHALWKAMEKHLASGSSSEPAQRAEAALSLSLFDTEDGTNAPGKNREVPVGFSFPNTTENGMDAVEDMEVLLIAKPHRTSFDKQVCRKRIGAAITFVASTVATVMLTRYIDKGSDCVQFDADSLSTFVGHSCDHAEAATMASGTVCVVQCKDGYRGGSLLQSTITCTSEGIWSGSPPICEPEVCTQGTALADSPTHCVGKTVGQVCDYECNMGFTVTGVHLCTLSGSTNQREMSGGSCVCGDDHYAFQLNEEPTRCLAMVTMQAAGFTADSTGIFSFEFSGSVPSDLNSGAVTVSTTASLTLTGTGAETIGTSFTAQGSLTLRKLSLTEVSLQATDAGQISVHACIGSLSDITIRDSTLEVVAGPEGLNVTGAVALTAASNLQDVLISGVIFADARIAVQSSTVLWMESCSGSLIPPSTGNTGFGLDVQQSTVHINNTLPAGFDITGLQVHASQGTSSVFSIDATHGQISGTVSFASSGDVALVGKTFQSVDLQLQDMGTVSMESCNVTLTAVNVQDTHLSISNSQGSLSSVNIQNSFVNIIGGQWSTTDFFYVNTGAQVHLRNFAGTISGMKVDGRSDSGPMGSCDGSVDTYCSSFTAHGGTGWNPTRTPSDWPTAYMYPNNCETHSPTCEGEAGSCCSVTGTAELCLSSWSKFGTTASTGSGCRNLALGATLTVDASTNASTTFSCGERYRGPLCDIVPKTCRSWYHTQCNSQGNTPSGQGNRVFGNTCKCYSSTCSSDYRNSGDGCDSYNCGEYGCGVQYTLWLVNDARCVNADTGC